ncbi:Uncharacterised protein [Klebsiella pneumoniae]|nr:Uncharacterised protein [Klebsiella pneumoniae]
MVIWSLQVAIRGTVSLTAYKTQLKNARHRLNEAPRRRILQMVQPLKLALMVYLPSLAFPHNSKK